MAVGLKLIASVVGAAGAIGGTVGTVLWQTGSFSVNSFQNSPDSPTSTGSVTGSEQVVEAPRPKSSPSPKKGNCEVIEASNKRIFAELSIDENDYVVISCTDTNDSDTEENIIDQWTGIFPEDLFISSYSDLDVGKFINLKMKTESIDEDDGDHKTTFRSNKFWDSSVVGVWGGTELSILDKKITPVKVKSAESRGDKDIYLLFKQTV